MADVVDHVAERVFRPRVDPAVGIELEWLTHDRSDPLRRPTLDELQAIIAAAEPRLAHRGRLTVEPGGQLELSTRPQIGTAAACRAAAGDLYTLERECARQGIDLVALGADPVRRPCRIVTEARYDAMQQHFDRTGPDGVAMMCNTAGLQLNVGVGDDATLLARWRLARAMVPFLVASFANSPFGEGGGPSGWCSTRLRHWWAIDPTRTAPVPADGHPVDSWVAYALAANTMLIRSDDGRWTGLDEPMPFAKWLVEGHELGWPTDDDLAYHLTTLFPPVRPRGWLELRLFDALPTPFWHVATAVTVALLDDAEASAAAQAAVAGTEDRWVAAAKTGLADPVLAGAARRCFAAAADALARADADDGVRAVVDRYRDRFIERGRCPADDLVDTHRRTGALLPRPESPLPLDELDLDAAWR
ncbi:ergothioneine biosynthesis glutamate--cysteine ligase EgtA [soil metagenome]